MVDKNDFLLKELSPKACIRPRAYNVIFRFIPCGGSFDLSLEEHLCNIEKGNDLQANSISTASWCKHPNKRLPGQTTATLKVACANPDVANHLLTGHIRVDGHLVIVKKDICIPLRCIKCQDYGHTRDSCIRVERYLNCSSEFHQSDKCNRSPTCVLCSPGFNHPSTFPNCPTFLRKCDALDGCFPKTTMPYFPSKDSWTWAASPANPPPPLQMTVTPSFQQASANQHSIRPQCQRPGVEQLDSKTHRHQHPKHNHIKQTTAGPRFAAANCLPSGINRPPSLTSGVPSKAPPLTIITLELTPTGQPNEHTTTIITAEPQDLATKCPQIENGTILRS